MAKTKKPKYKVCEKCEHYQKSLRKAKRGGFFFKVLTAEVVLFGQGCVAMSYALAWRDHLNVVETLSVAIVSQIIAPVITYAVSKTVENIFEKNKTAFSTPLTALTVEKEPQTDDLPPYDENDATDDDTRSDEGVMNGGLEFLKEFEPAAEQEAGNGKG